MRSPAESPLQQDGQTPGKTGALCDDPDLPGGEGVAKEQRPVGLRPGTAGVFKSPAAELLLCLAGKGHLLRLLAFFWAYYTPKEAVKQFKFFVGFDVVCSCAVFRRYTPDV